MKPNSAEPANLTGSAIASMSESRRRPDAESSATGCVVFPSVEVEQRLGSSPNGVAGGRTESLDVAVVLLNNTVGNTRRMADVETT